MSPTDLNVKHEMQTLNLRILNLETMFDSRRPAVTGSKHEVYSPKITPASERITDATLLQYYRMNRKAEIYHKVLVQKISESSSYIVLFPTGLMLVVGALPLTV